MRRIMTRAFQYNNERFIFTVDTDYLCWFLKCHEGSSEKNTVIDLSQQKDLKARIFKLVSEEEGYSLADDLFKTGNRISSELRKYYNIPYPISTDLQLLINKLNGSGHLILGADQCTEIMDYLSAHDVRYIEFLYGGNHHIYTSYLKLDAFQEELLKTIQEKQSEIKDLSNLLSEISYTSREII